MTKRNKVLSHSEIITDEVVKDSEFLLDMMLDVQQRISDREGSLGEIYRDSEFLTKMVRKLQQRMIARDKVLGELYSTIEERTQPHSNEEFLKAMEQSIERRKGKRTLKTLEDFLSPTPISGITTAITETFYGDTE